MENYLQEQERKAAANRQRIAALAREKLAERMRQDDQKRQEQRARDMREQDRKRAEDARARDRQQQEHRARAREFAKAKAAETLKKEAEKAKDAQKEPEKEKQMSGASQGPSMRPVPKQWQAAEMAAEMDHPGMNDAQKAELQRQGVAMGEGFKNREEARKKEEEARESRKTPADKAQDRVWFKSGLSYEKRQELEIARDKHRVRQIEEARNAKMKTAQKEQTREPDRTPPSAPAKAKAGARFEFAKEPDEPVRGGH